MEIALNSDTPGGFNHENAIASQNGLALLASITLKNALNITNNDNSTIKNKNNINKNKNFTLNHNKNNIKYHKASQPQHGFISTATKASTSLSSAATAATVSSLSTSSASNSAAMPTEQRNVFTFTPAGLEALTATAISTIESEIRAVTVARQDNEQLQNATSTGLKSDEAISSKNKNNSNNGNHHTSLSTNHQQTTNTLSAKDPTVALLEALSIKTTKKKQQNVSTQQQQISANSSSGAAAAATTKTAHTSGGIGGNNNTNNHGNNSGSSNKNIFRIPSDILDDLASRFIINVPDMELSNLIRICFQIELAHWFYLDFFCASEEENKLQTCGIKQFALQIFEHIPFLRQHLSAIDKILEDWKNYKLSVPTYGAILISEDLNYCLLVQSYFAKSSWGFPKGKINENEDPVHCATREVYEETGYDITELIVPNDYVEAVINYQYTRLYIVCDVSLETKFSPRTRNEIKCCDWFPIESLPLNKTDAISKPKLGKNANSFFMIMPFVKRLKKWVNDKRNGIDTRRKYSSGGSPSSTSPLTTTIMMNGQTKSGCKKLQKRNNLNNFNDDINALNNVAGGGAAATTALYNCGNNYPNTNVICSNSNSNRSTRQRHKSMGDLDGINFNNCNNQINCNLTMNNNNNNNCVSTTASGTTTAISGGNINTNNNNNNNNNNNSNNSNQKRHSKLVAAGSNVSNMNNCSSNNNINNSGNISSKRQLFHSQSQTSNLQQNSEKIVSSFDLIRREKQQMKAAIAKTQKQQQNLNDSNGRQRAKSQSDKMGTQLQQQQQQQQQKSAGNASSNSKQQQQQRIQKQHSLIVINSNMRNYNINNNNNNSHHNNINSNKSHNNNKNNINTKTTNVNNSVNNNNNNNSNNNNNNKMTSGVYQNPTPPPLSGSNLLAVAAAAAAATSIAHTTTITPQEISGICGRQQSQQQQHKPRPSSVSLHFPDVSTIKSDSTADISAISNQMPPQFKRMNSATNLRILKGSTSHQTTQQTQQPQPPQRQASAIQFTPSFNSWTNFTFTKNFIANVFC